MRHIEIDFSGKVPRITDKYAGEKGEHQAVTLDVIPEAAMSSDEDLAFYYLLFKVEGGLVASRTFNQGEDISVALWGQLTENRNVVFQLIGTNGLETIIAKSPIITLYLGESLEGTVIGIDDNRDSLIAMIGAFNERLTEDERTIATLVASSQGDLAQTDDEAPDFVKNKRNSLLENDANYITVDGVRYYEVYNGSGEIKLTGTELYLLFNNTKKPVCYQGRPIIAVGNDASYYLFAYIDQFTEGFTVYYFEVRGDQKTLKDGTEKRGGSFRYDENLFTFNERNDSEAFVTNGAIYKYLTDNYYKKTEIYSKTETDELIPTYVKATEILKDNTHFICKGSELLTRWQNGEIFTCDGFSVLYVKQTSTTVWAYYINHDKRIKCQGVPSNADTPTSATYSAYLLSADEYTKLSGGEVAEGNTKFVTGDQVYQAIQAALNN